MNINEPLANEKAENRFTSKIRHILSKWPKKSIMQVIQHVVVINIPNVNNNY